MYRNISQSSVSLCTFLYTGLKLAKLRVSLCREGSGDGKAENEGYTSLMEFSASPSVCHACYSLRFNVIRVLAYLEHVPR